ncbi:MAG TPA: hypothetical protein VNK95_12090 [Caldilineaceae bacterium]|nr:hypothetical protein [Caldilineaceae bacterium]
MSLDELALITTVMALLAAIRFALPAAAMWSLGQVARRIQRLN